MHEGSSAYSDSETTLVMGGQVAADSELASASQPISVKRLNASTETSICGGEGFRCDVEAVWLGKKVVGAP
eukprot:5500231-Amphidinium_carterae.1